MKTDDELVEALNRETKIFAMVGMRFAYLSALKDELHERFDCSGAEPINFAREVSYVLEQGRLLKVVGPSTSEIAKFPEREEG